MKIVSFPHHDCHAPDIREPGKADFPVANADDKRPHGILPSGKFPPPHNGSVESCRKYSIVIVLPSPLFLPQGVNYFFSFNVS